MSEQAPAPETSEEDKAWEIAIAYRLTHARTSVPEEGDFRCGCAKCEALILALSAFRAAARAEGAKAGAEALKFVRGLCEDQGDEEEILSKPDWWAADYKQAMTVLAQIPEIESAAIKRGAEAERTKVVAFLHATRDRFTRLRMAGADLADIWGDAIKGGAHEPAPKGEEQSE
jgi:hypothetical protein